MSVAFPYPGGKHRILDWLFEMFPEEGRLYVEPFAGRGNVFFGFYPRGGYEGYRLNDLNTGNFFGALARCPLADLPEDDEVEMMFPVFKNRALINDPVALSIEPIISFHGKGYRYGYRADRYNKRRITDRIQQAQTMLLDTKVKWSKTDWVWLPWSEYTEEDFIYLDPPYTTEFSTGYGNIDHDELCQKLTDTKARWILSGYDNAIYREYFGDPDAELERQLEMTKVKNTSTALECVWSNM